jgi:hypothetical protein
MVSFPPMCVERQRFYYPTELCHKRAPRFAPMYVNTGLLSIFGKCLRAGLIGRQCLWISLLRFAKLPFHLRATGSLRRSVTFAAILVSTKTLPGRRVGKSPPPSLWLWIHQAAKDPKRNPWPALLGLSPIGH